MTQCELFKLISENVWNDICRNHRRKNRLNEEGISRQTVINKIQNYVEDHRSFKVFAQKAINEVDTGGDLEIYLDNGQQKFHRILLQAKLMEVNCCFENLNRNSGSTGRRQYDTLNSFANRIGANAHYLMYNGCPDYTDSGSDCAGFYDEKQFGCAILSVDYIKNHCETNTTGTLGSSRNVRPFGNPWRILTCCDYDQNNGTLYDFDEIDMDSHFRSLFTPPGLIRFITTDDIKGLQIDRNNNFIHNNGWNPSARIIISDQYMTKDRDGILFI